MSTEEAEWNCSKNQRRFLRSSAGKMFLLVVRPTPIAIIFLWLDICM